MPQEPSNSPPRGPYVYRSMPYPKDFVRCSHPKPALLDKAFQSIYYKLLPSMGVNRCITKPYRMLPEKYQGLALPNPNIWVLSAKLILIREHWEQDTTLGNMLTHAYQAFQMEVGLGGNIFGKCFKSLGIQESLGTSMDVQNCSEDT